MRSNLVIKSVEDQKSNTEILAALAMNRCKEDEGKLLEGNFAIYNGGVLGAIYVIFNDEYDSSFIYNCTTPDGVGYVLGFNWYYIDLLNKEAIETVSVRKKYRTINLSTGETRTEIIPEWDGDGYVY